MDLRVRPKFHGRTRRSIPRYTAMPRSKAKPLKRIAVVGGPLLQSVASPFNAVLAHFAAERGDWRFVFSSYEITSSLFHVLRELGCDGAMVRIVSEKLAEEARQLPFPVVNWSSWLAEPGLPTVRRDDRALGRLCAEHLLEKGFRRFGCLRLPGGWFIEARTEGFVAALRAAPVDADISFSSVDSHPPSRSDEARFCKWLAELRSPAALFLPDDVDASILMDLCRKVGRRIPQDIAVVSAFGHAVTAQHSVPAFSFADDDEATIAQKSAELLARLIDGKRAKAKIVLVPPRGLVALGSTDTLAIDDPQVAHAEDFLRCHAGEDINVADAAHQASIARVTLERRFREALGTSMHEYLTRLRVERAKELLQHRPPLPLGQIAENCGFAGRLRLNAVFKQRVGMTPNAWRGEAK